MVNSDSVARRERLVLSHTKDRINGEMEGERVQAFVCFLPASVAPIKSVRFSHTHHMSIHRYATFRAIETTYLYYSLMTHNSIPLENLKLIKKGFNSCGHWFFYGTTNTSFHSKWSRNNKCYMQLFGVIGLHIQYWFSGNITHSGTHYLIISTVLEIIKTYSRGLMVVWHQ